MTDPLLLSAARVCTFAGQRSLTNASSFFFERDKRLYLVTSRHVMIDEPSAHFPDRIEVELHVDANNLTEAVAYSIPLYRNGIAQWRQGLDGAGEIDVAVIEIDRDKLPAAAVFHAFTPKHLLADDENVAIGSQLLIVGFPLGFHDTLHHMPVARQASLASCHGLRFQGEGYFLTDARTHRGTSGAPVVMGTGDAFASSGLPWRLLGVHSSRLDVGGRDRQIDEALGLNSAWYADILLVLTEPPPNTISAVLTKASGKAHADSGVAVESNARRAGGTTYAL